MAVTFNWYRRTLHDSQFTDNLNLNGFYNVPGAHWAPYTVINPLDGENLTFFRLEQSAFGIAANNVVTNYASDSQDRSNTYTGFEIGASARLPRSSTAYIAWTFDHTINVACDATDNPNTLRFCDESGNSRLGEAAVERPYRHEVKLGGNLPLWYGFEASAALQSYAGAEKGVFWTITPAATRNPIDCTVPGCTPSAIVMTSRYAGDGGVTLNLITPGTRYLPRTTQLDFGLKRAFALGGSRRVTAEFNVYNLLNDNAVLTELQTLGSNASVAPFVEGAAGGRPTGIMYPRIMRIAASLRF
jgi:hypothetical protein